MQSNGVPPVLTADAPPVIGATPAVPPVLPAVISPVITLKPRVWTVFVLYAITLAAILLVSAAVVTGVALARYGTLTADHMKLAAESAPGMLGSLLAVMIVVAGAATAGALLSRLPWCDRLRLRGINASLPSLLVGSTGIIGIGLVLLGLTGLSLIPPSPALESFDRFIKGLSAPGLLAALIVAGLLPGIAEEMFFRGFVQTRLRARWGCRWAILWTSLMFGVMHFDFIHGCFAVAIGLFLGYLTEWADSIVPAMICHATNNVISILLSANGVDFVGRQTNLLVLAIGLLVVAAAVLYLRSHRSPSMPTNQKIEPS